MNIVGWNYVFVSVGSFLAGNIVTLGYLKWRGYKIVIPHINSSSRNMTIFAIILALVTLATVLNQEANQRETERCNNEFRAALKYNTEVTAEQRDVNDRAQKISRDRREILDEMFVDIGETIEGNPGRISDIVSTYNVRAQELGREYDELIAYRSSLDKKRTPYPEPSCGLG